MSATVLISHTTRRRSIRYDRTGKLHGNIQMTDLDRALADLVIANRILAHENVVDAYGHVSVRHPHNPKRYLLARSLSPEMVESGDIMEFDLEGNAVAGDTRQPYLERFIHGAVYEA